VAVAAAAVVVGCGGSDADGERLDVVAGSYPLAFAAERVGGESVSVTNLTPAGAEPHDVELSARDVERVRSADVVLYVGSGFQPALEEAVEGARGKAVDVLQAVGGRRAEERPTNGEDTEADPHVWLDPVRYAEVVERIAAVLGRPRAAEAIERELRELNGEFRAGLADCARREVVVSHAAFGYLAARYGLEQIALTGLSPEAEPSARALERVIDEVRERRATTVFVETLVSPRLAETVAREAGAGTAVLNPLEGLTDEELERGDDYFSVMRANLAALRKGLACR
jgi:zinc transport system substrate-binding protein